MTGIRLGPLTNASQYGLFDYIASVVGIMSDTHRWVADGLDPLSDNISWIGLFLELLEIKTSKRRERKFYINFIIYAT